MTDRQFRVRLPEELADEINMAALNGYRSFNSEVVNRLRNAGRGESEEKLRDMFAGQALNGMMDGYYRDMEKGISAEQAAKNVPSFARFAYQFADAMLAERSK